MWAQKGAIGRLYNLATYIRRSDQQRQVLRDLQGELTSDDVIFTIDLIIDGKTRWNPVYLMVKRGELTP